MSRFALLALLLSLLLASTVASSVTYTVYSDANCQTAVSSGTQSTQYASTSSASGYAATCFGISGVSGASYAYAGCVTPSGGANSGAMVAFSDSGCTQQVASWSDTPPGACGKQNGGSGSVIINCNGAMGMAALSLPLLAALSVVASLWM